MSAGVSTSSMSRRFLRSSLWRAGPPSPAGGALPPGAAAAPAGRGCRSASWRCRRGPAATAGCADRPRAPACGRRRSAAARAARRGPGRCPAASATGLSSRAKPCRVIGCAGSRPGNSQRLRPRARHAAAAASRGAAERHQPFPAALAAHRQHRRTAASARALQRQQLGHAQPGGVQQLQRRHRDSRRVRPRGRGGQQRRHLRLGQVFRQRARQARRVQRLRRVVRAHPFAQQEAVELPQAGQPPRRGAGRQPGGVQPAR